MTPEDRKAMRDYADANEHQVIAHRIRRCLDALDEAEGELAHLRPIGTAYANLNKIDMANVKRIAELEAELTKQGKQRSQACAAVVIAQERIAELENDVCDMREMGP